MWYNTYEPTTFLLWSKLVRHCSVSLLGILHRALQSSKSHRNLPTSNIYVTFCPLQHHQLVRVILTSGRWVFGGMCGSLRCYRSTSRSWPRIPPAKPRTLWTMECRGELAGVPYAPKWQRKIIKKKSKYYCIICRKPFIFYCVCVGGGDMKIYMYVLLRIKKDVITWVYKFYFISSSHTCYYVYNTCIIPIAPR